MSDWIFAAPLWLPTMLGLVGVVVFIEGNRRNKKPLRIAGVSIFVLSIVLFTLREAVDTDKKKVARATQQLVDSVRTGKWDTVSSLLEPDAVITIAGTGTPIRGADQIVQTAKVDLSFWPISGTWIDSLTLDQTGTEITATMTLRSQFEAYPTVPVPSTWQLDWVKDGNAWRVHEIHAIQLGDKTGPDMGRVLQKK